MGLLLLMGALLGVVSFVESHQVLSGQIALGIDPDEAVKFVTLAIAAETLLFAAVVFQARRVLLARGELRFVGTTVIFLRGGSWIAHDTSELTRVTSSPGGANIRVRFHEKSLTLSGQWLPNGWRPTWRGFRTPGGAAIRLTRKTHPLLVALRSRRPDLRPGLSGKIWAEMLVIPLLAVVLPEISNYPMVIAIRETTARQKAHEAMSRAFDEGRYAGACDAYRRALPSLKHDVYGCQDASLALLYCGDAGNAMKAFVGYDVTPFWPVAADREVLARIRIAMGKYAQAEALLRPGPSYLLYVALAEEGRQADADEVLERMTQKSRFAEALLLRHRGRATESLEAVATICSRLRNNTTCPALLLARRFEACFLAEGLGKTMQDSLLAAAIGALPGLRAELIRFVDREAPELGAAARAAFERARNVR